MTVRVVISQCNFFSMNAEAYATKHEQGYNVAKHIVDLSQKTLKNRRQSREITLNLSRNSFNNQAFIEKPTGYIKIYEL